MVQGGARLFRSGLARGPQPGQRRARDLPVVLGLVLDLVPDALVTLQRLVPAAADVGRKIGQAVPASRLRQLHGARPARRAQGLSDRAALDQRGDQEAHAVIVSAEESAPPLGDGDTAEHLRQQVLRVLEARDRGGSLLQRQQGAPCADLAAEGLLQQAHAQGRGNLRLEGHPRLRGLSPPQIPPPQQIAAAALAQDVSIRGKGLHGLHLPLQPLGLAQPKGVLGGADGCRSVRLGIRARRQRGPDVGDRRDQLGVVCAQAF